MNMNKESLKSILKNISSIALIGASPNPDRDSYKVMKFLINKGYEIVAFQMPLRGTNPRIKTLKGLETKRHESLIIFNTFLLVMVRFGFNLRNPVWKHE